MVDSGISEFALRVFAEPKIEKKTQVACQAKPKRVPECGPRFGTANAKYNRQWVPENGPGFAPLSAKKTKMMEKKRK